MAAAGQPEFPPILPAGIHEVDLPGRRNLCLDRFPASVTRPRIFANVEAVVTDINRNAIAGEILIDGSFLTEKLNPDDADLVFLITDSVFKGLNVVQRSFFDNFRKNSLYQACRIDNYGVVIDENGPTGVLVYAYWLRQFGFSRKDEMKGILRISVPFLVTP